MLKWLGGIAIGAVLGAGTVLLLLRLELPVVEHATPAPAPTEEPHPTEQRIPLRVPTVHQSAPPEAPATFADTRRLASRSQQQIALLEVLRSSDPRTMEALLDEAGTLDRFSPSREFAEHAIYTRYAELDPQGALGRMVADEVSWWGLREVIALCAMTDPDGVLDYVDALDEPHRKMLAGIILREVKGRSDIQNAFAARFSLHRELDRARTLEAADTDPAGAWHAALSLDARSRPGSLNLIATDWARSDPVAAFEAAGALADSQLRENVERAVVSEWMRNDPDAALNWVLALPTSSHREAIATALNTLARTDYKAALDTLVDLGDRILVERLSLRMAWNWGTSEPRAAFDWAVAETSSQMQVELIHPVMSTIARTAPEDAISLASRLDDALQRAAAFRSVFATWAQSDVRAAARWIEASPQPPSDAAYQLIPAYAKLDPEEAFDWLMSLDAPQHRHVDRLITETAKESPGRARQLFGRIPDGPTKERAAKQLVTGWIRVDPQAAVGVIPRLGVDETDALFKNAFRTWCESDPEAATAFLGRVPNASRDSAIMGIIDHALSRGNDVALAERMYNRLTSDDMRREAAATSHSRLRVVDPERAKRYGG
ncbi:MAG: hypothetical protein OXI79_10520 [Gammaproteobacteria bacterium]|nr:hypothetical protein [Gammaproteobacteria bacterium]